MKIRFIVTGKPIGKQRPRFTKAGHCYTPKETKEYENRIKQSYITASNGFKFENGVQIVVHAYYPKAKSNKSDFVNIKPDIDNVIKCVLDALNGIAYDDDKQICSVIGHKAWEKSEPFIEVEIYGSVRI